MKTNYTESVIEGTEKMKYLMMKIVMTRVAVVLIIIMIIIIIIVTGMKLSV